MIMYMFKKKYVALFLVGQMLFAGSIAQAETAVSASASVVAPKIEVVANSVVPIKNLDRGFVQFNNLMVQSVSASSGVITASREYPPLPVMPMGSSAETTSVSPARIGIDSSTCYSYEKKDTNVASVVSCPTPPQYVGAPDILYTIKIDASTQLLLRDRSVATLGSFAMGDQINVFGYYNSDGSISAYLVRNLSKPVSREFIQLNNMTLVSVSGNTLALVQDQPSPCYRFEGETSVKSTIYPCPMGVTDFSVRAETKNVAAPASLSAQWMMVRKYVVIVDANTVILDRNRTRLTISNLQVGDKLNIYGETSDNGQNITADIIRDLSLPVAAQEYSGKVTAVNADGSFVIQTDTGRTVTVKNPVEVGMTVKIRGLLDEVQNIITQISQMNLSR